MAALAEHLKQAYMRSFAQTLAVSWLLKAFSFSLEDHLLTAYDSLDLIILPGMAFDNQGTRLGRGRGYFDTLLSHPQFAGVYKIGICFDFQKFTTLPHEPHDVRVDEVI